MTKFYVILVEASSNQLVLTTRPDNNGVQVTIISVNVITPNYWQRRNCHYMVINKTCFYLKRMYKYVSPT